MSEFNNIIAELNEAIQKLANKWSSANEKINDIKVQEIGTAVIKPVSDIARKLCVNADNLNKTLELLEDKKIIDDK